MNIWRRVFYGSLTHFFGGVAPFPGVTNGVVVLGYRSYALFLIRYRGYDGIANLLHV